ncbi:Transcription factor bHLH70 [Spatholobus suberectus]|nr:Transcription factor bHLH70 [Spatholobus suberectus]
MERFQGPLSSCFFGEYLDVNCLEQGLVGAECLKLEENEQSLASSLEDNMPFLQMLQSVESPQFIPFKEPSFETMKKPWEGMRSETQSQAVELESCVTHDLVETQSPLKSESNELQHLHSAWGVEKVNYECNKAEDCSMDAVVDSNAAWHRGCKTRTQVGTRERRKRTRTRQTKNKEDIENQRMTHIAVERNRRRQMNDHLSVLKSLMPPSYVQMSDHASIIGGAIDFVKELEQLLQSLEAQKRVRKNEEVGSSGLFEHGYEKVNCGDEVKAEKNSEAGAVEVTVIQTHVNLKIQCLRRPGKLIKAIVALENLRLTILHLNITSTEATVLYSFNLKIEEDSKVVSASEIAEAVDHIFRSINDS